MPNHHSKKHKPRRHHSSHHHRAHHIVTETTPTPPPQENPKPSAFARLRIILLLVVLIALLGVLYLLWNIFVAQQRADYIISGEDLFRTGIIDRIVRVGPSQPAPEIQETEQPPQDPSQEAQLVEQRANAPSDIAQGEQTYFIRTSGNGPTLTKLVISEFDPAVGTTQGIRVEAENEQAISSLTATMKTDKNTETYTLQVIEGDATKGVWAVQWPVTDTHNTNYTLILEANSPSQPTSKVELTFR